MAKILLCTEQETESLMRLTGIRNSNPWIYSIDLDRTVPSDISEQKKYYRFPNYPRSRYLCNKYGNIVIDVQLFSISEGNLSNYMKSAYEGRAYTDTSVLSSSVIRSFKSQSNTGSLYSFASLIYDILDNDRTALFTINRNEFDDVVNHEQCLAIKKIFKTNALYPIEIYTADDYMQYGEAICIENAYEIKQKLLRFMIENHGTRSSRNDDICYSGFPENLIPSDAISLAINDLRALCLELGYDCNEPTGQINKLENFTINANEEKIELTKILSRHIAKRWYEKLLTRDIDTMTFPELKLWLIRLDANVPEVVSKKTAKDLLREFMADFEKYLAGRSRRALDELSNIALMNKIRVEKMDGITSPCDDRDACIREILIFYGEIDEQYVLPEREYLKAMNKTELWDIFKTYYLDTTKQHEDKRVFTSYPKSAIIDLLEEYESERQRKKISKNLYKDDLLALDIEEIRTYFKNLSNNKSIIKDVEYILKTSDSKDIAIDRICINFGIKYKFEKLGKDIKSREELEEMSKQDLIDFGRLQYKLLLDKSQKRSSIIKIIERAQKEYEKEIDKNNRASDFNRENLMKLSKKDLIILSKTVQDLDVRLNPTLSKRKMVDKLLRGYYNNSELSEGHENPYRKSQPSKLEIYLKERNKEFMKNNSLGMIMTDVFDTEKGIEKIEFPEEENYIEKGIEEMENTSIEDILESTRNSLKEIEDKVQDLREENKKFGIKIEEPEVKEEDEKSEKENKNININRGVKGMKGFGGYLLNEGFSVAEELRNQRCRENQRNNDRNKDRGYKDMKDRKDRNQKDNNQNRGNSISDRLRKIYS